MEVLGFNEPTFCCRCGRSTIAVFNPCSTCLAEDDKKKKIQKKIDIENGLHYEWEFDEPSETLDLDRLHEELSGGVAALGGAYMRDLAVKAPIVYKRYRDRELKRRGKYQLWCWNFLDFGLKENNWAWKLYQKEDKRILKIYSKFYEDHDGYCKAINKLKKELCV